MEIRAELGAGWQIVRINTDYLEENAKLLLEAVEAVLDYRHKRKLI